MPDEPRTAATFTLPKPIREGSSVNLGGIVKRGRGMGKRKLPAEEVPPEVPQVPEVPIAKESRVEPALVDSYVIPGIAGVIAPKKRGRRPIVPPVDA